MLIALVESVIIFLPFGNHQRIILGQVRQGFGQALRSD
jgi:hypothetical protein